VKFTTLLPLALCSLSACNQRSAARTEGGPAPAERPVASAPAQNPFATATPVSPSESRFVGRVIQRLDAGSYVYLEVDQPDAGPTWVVTAEALAPDADRVSVQVVKRVEHFESRRLKRSFSPLSFAIIRKDHP
jgi:hypothetical protein